MKIKEDMIADKEKQKELYEEIKKLFEKEKYKNQPMLVMNGLEVEGIDVLDLTECPAHIITNNQLNKTIIHNKQKPPSAFK